MGSAVELNGWRRSEPAGGEDVDKVIGLVAEVVREVGANPQLGWGLGMEGLNAEGEVLARFNGSWGFSKKLQRARMRSRSGK